MVMDSFKSVNFNIEEELLPTNIGSIDTILGKCIVCTSSSRTSKSDFNFTQNFTIDIDDDL